MRLGGKQNKYNIVDVLKLPYSKTYNFPLYAKKWQLMKLMERAGMLVFFTDACKVGSVLPPSRTNVNRNNWWASGCLTGAFVFGQTNQTLNGQYIMSDNSVQTCCLSWNTHLIPFTGFTDISIYGRKLNSYYDQRDSRSWSWHNIE